MWKEILEKLVELLKHMINILMVNCCRDNECVSECCVKKEETNIFEYDKDERSNHKTD